MWTRGLTAVALAMLVACVVLSPAATAKVIYVDDDATGAKDGSSWIGAFLCLQDALSVAQDGDEIRIAQGTYKPDQTAGATLLSESGFRINASGDRTATFQLKNDVVLRGGYAGIGEADPNRREVDAYPTVLSGDLMGDDPPSHGTRAWLDLILPVPDQTDNSHHVVTATNTDKTAVLDGCVITGGNSSGATYEDGAGMRCECSSPTVINCTFAYNTTPNEGGAISINCGSPKLLNCTFASNSGYRGGAVSLGTFDSSDGSDISAGPTLMHCVFRLNYAEYRGGGIYSNLGQVSLIVTGCTFIGNRSGDYGDSGGAAYVGDGTFVNCVFSGNSAPNGAGLTTTKASLTNCTLSGNKAQDSGGGVTGGQAILTNCILWGNADSGGNVEAAQVRGGNINFCCIQGWTGSLGGTGNHGKDPLFVDAEGLDDVVGTEDDNLRLLAGSPCIDTGDQTEVPPMVDTDFDGKPRTINNTVDMGAYEGPHQGFLTNTHSIEIPEGKDASFAVALAMAPEDTVAVTVAIRSGDRDITIRPPHVLTFDSSNYWLPKTLTLAAAPDTDSLHGSAVISISADGFPTIHILAREIDDALGKVLYVDKRARGAGDGTNWENAFTDLQEALGLASTASTVEEIRVAQGTYRPAGSGGDREATFQLINGVALRGGYGGVGAPDPNARDIHTYQTILDGDLNGNDVKLHSPSDMPGEQSRGDNCFQVVTGSYTNATAVLNGFTVRGGSIDGSYGAGGGMWNFYGSPTISDCTFDWNNGPGMHSVEGSPTIHNCVFKYNGSGGFCSYNTCAPALTLTNCAFIGNWADSIGGGICTGGAGLRLANCLFTGNSATFGGGVYYGRVDSLQLINCVFTGNVAVYGGAVCGFEGNLIFSNCTLVGNSADHGSALSCACPDEVDPDPYPQEDGLTGQVELTNCILWNGDGQIDPSCSRVTYTISYSNVQGGWPGESNIDIEPGFVDADGPDDRFGTEDDNPRLQAGSPCIDAGNNTAGSDANVPAVQLLLGTDADLNVRRSDDLATIDGGNGTSPVIDMGSYEFNTSPVPSILYVDDDAEGANTGISWKDAFNDLQMALQTAFVASEKVRQIWVAAGTYRPALPGADRSATFELINDLAIYGGFAGTEEALDQRDPIANVTILSGDLNGDDGPDYANYEENCYHVVTAKYTGTSAVLNGFTITAGNADSPDSLVSGVVNDRGAGLYIVVSNPQIRNCIVRSNSADLAGGLWYERAQPTLADCAICGNSATIAGGGVYCSFSTPELTGCTFIENEASDQGGGVFLSSSSPNFSQCTFSANTARDGGGVFSDHSHSSFGGCTFTDNRAEHSGGGLFGDGGQITLSASSFTDNLVNAFHILDAEVNIHGSVRMVSGDVVGDKALFRGDGALSIQSGSTLELCDCRIGCDISGPGTIRVPLDSELTLEGDALIDLADETEPNGLILCDGLLRAKDKAVVANAQINVNRASFEDNAILANCIFEAEAGAPYGQFFVEDSVQLWLDKILADGDRYLDLDPREFDCNDVHVDRIEVSITEGTGGTQGGLFECRGTDYLASPCGPDEFLCPMDRVPDFSPDTWTLDRLELVHGAKLNLTNRFDFQAPYDTDGEYEVLYVRELVLGSNSVLNTAFNRLYYETLTMDPTAEVVHVPLLGFSLNNITFDDENDFRTRVVHNNVIDEDEKPPDTTRIHVERVVGHELDPNGVMRMCNLRDTDPDSPTYGQTIQARAKGLFAKSNEQEIMIQFEYLFTDLTGKGELAIYLSDTPELLDHGDPLRDLHYLEVIRLPHPPAGRPGSAGSGTWGVFQDVVSRGDLDFVRGTRVEFELIGPEGTCVLINNWDPAIRCTMTCGDVAGAYHEINAVDFLAVLSECGQRIDNISTPEAFGAGCLDGFFCRDGYVTTDDAMAVDWVERKSLCPEESLPADLQSSFYAYPSVTSPEPGKTRRSVKSAAVGARDLQGEFIVAGKRYEYREDDVDDFLSDRLYGMDRYGNLVSGPFALDHDRLNGRLVRDHEGTLYQLNLERDLVRLADDTPVVAPSALTVEIDPRHGEPATVYLGLQQTADRTWGRPLLDAAFDAEGYIYVVPVVVVPAVGDLYLAAAKLAISQDPQSHTVVQLLDDPPLPNENRNTDQLREIEVGIDGRVYVLNRQCNNGSDVLWVYDQNGQLLIRQDLQQIGITAPVGLCVSVYDGSRLYLSSSENAPDSNVVSVYVLSMENLDAENLDLAEIIKIRGMGHITDLTENPIDGTLYAVGFVMPEIPSESEVQDAETILNRPPFYQARLAVIPYGSTDAVDGTSFSGASVETDLALPLSIIWRAPNERSSDLADLSSRPQDSLTFERWP